MLSTVTVAQATALEFRVPSSRGARSDGSYAHNVIIRLRATRAGDSLEGVGEAAPRTRIVTGDTPRGSWRFLDAALRELRGTTITPGVATARAEIGKLMADLGLLAERTLRTTVPGAPYRGALAGVECALLDLVGRSGSAPLAEVLGGARRPVPVAQVISAARGASHVEQRAARDSGQAVIKLTDISDHREALDVALAAASAAGRLAPIWLELTSDLPLSDAITLVESLSSRVDRGELPAHLVLQPASTGDLTGLVRLQAAADRLVPTTPEGPGIVVMASPASIDDAHAAVDGGLRGIVLDPARLGGYLCALDVGQWLEQRDGDVRVAVSTVPHVSAVSVAAAADLAAALPRLDYCALESSRAKGTVTIEPPPRRDGRRRLELGDAPGIGGDIVLSGAVQYMTRYTDGSQAPPPPPTYAGLTANTFDLDTLLHFEKANGSVDTANPLLDRAALAYGLNTTRLGRGVLFAGHPKLAEPIGFASRRSSWTGVSTRAVVDKKDLAKKILHAAGVAVPQGDVFNPDQSEQAVRYALSLGVPVVVKPRAGSHGAGVTTDLREEGDIRSAIAALASTSFAQRAFVVEEYAPGEDYRFLVVGDRVVSVVLRRPASVHGDGRSSVLELVIQKNRHRLENPQTHGSLIELGQNAGYWLDRQGLTLDSVPAEGSLVKLGSAGNIANGGDSVEVLDETHPSLLDLAVRATQAIPGLDHSGVDLIGDHRLSTDEHRAVVIEVNSNPGTDLNHFPIFGTPRDVSTSLILRQCELAGYRPSHVLDRLSVRIDVWGRVQGVGYRRWFERLANERGVVGSIRNLSSGQVEAHIAGDLNDVWLLSSLAVTGPPRAKPNRVVTTHVSEVSPIDRFEVR